MIIAWLPKAIANRDELIDYIAEENLRAAIEQDSLIEAQVNHLVAHPEIGHAGRKKGSRELVIAKTNFVVIYRIRPTVKRVEIIRVLHTSQAWPV
ncbi:MAG: type II toxin-antitoxin system mRNA interferase toxin, RelE/StbE family [Gallionellales bacterium CG_4_10_14_3_um_filter_54_96]|nr:MAG: type II toxin-antitoxin system mRNA interferase toxin, RelE/StbE family [Gallionellales bacterium CG17_big_fil_post_rev_8_21_14_2_50_54_146]PIX03601.1 MAG: type II toxin-antitoxin system mRNA interferase toxin, RelE/StbE family [Gallionellales bacterium CG_4_8_14_3_um_filter_54_18]PIY03586.1 MAG: type II toxin-antitoxin system mRNA interferase toxin, RelE/StbE family [Gallionellales bacterium CG_4_10_14_3_um_filter_54_96]